MAGKRIQTFEDFWPFYLGEHRYPATRWFHFVGSSSGILFVVWALIDWNPWWVLAGVVVGYAFAWFSHFFIEKNKPASFSYPWWSFRADWKMWLGMLTGRIRGVIQLDGTPDPQSASD